MHNEELQIYPFYDAQQLNFSDRSRLFPISPIGIGTILTESLTSYISRLAEVHSVKTGILLMHEIAPLMGSNCNLNSERYCGQKIQGKEGGIDKLFANATKSFNGIGEWTISLIQILEYLTSVKDLSYLTLISWKEVLSTRNLLKKQRAWCPLCFHDWKNTQGTLYEPLIWNLELVKLCPQHNTLLVTKCPHCQKTNRVLEWNSRVGFCSKCKQWLGVINKQNYNVSTEDLDLQFKINQNIGDLIKAVPNLSSLPYKSIISYKLIAYLEAIASGKKSTFARFIKTPIPVLHRWCKRQNIPDINNLLKICWTLDTSLLDFLTKENIEIPDEVFQNIKKYQSAKSHSFDRSKKHCKEEIILSLQKALKESPPPSMTEIVTRINIPKSTIRSYSRDLCSAISARHQKYIKNKKIEEHTKLLKEILESNEYPFPSLKEVSRRLKIGTHVLRKTCPELSKLISLRYLNDRSDQADIRRQKLREDVRRIAIQLHENGEEPFGYKISEKLDKPLTIIQGVALESLREIRKELGYED